jgi:hypothetical protein
MAFTADKVRQGVQQAAAGGYSIDNSLRLNDDDSAYLSRTPSSAGNRKTWTWSGWVKRGNISAFKEIFSSGGTNFFYIHFRDTDKLEVGHWISATGLLQTTAKYRDSSAWYHILVVMDTTQSTSSNRFKLYVNGLQVTDFGSSNYPSLNYESDCNTASAHYIGERKLLDKPWDGYLAEVHFIDGQALDPTSFGETGDYGEWKPIKVTGMTYGTNGFYLDFSNKGTKHTLTANGNVQHSTAQSKIGGSSIYFDGSGDYIGTSQSSDFNVSSQSSSWTVEGWFRFNDTSVFQNIIIIGGSASYQQVSIFLQGGKFSMAGDYGGPGTGGWDISLSGSTTLSNNTWYHISFVNNSGVITGYLDGVSECTYTLTSDIYIVNPVFLLGAHYEVESHWFNGYADEVRFSNSARYTSNFTPSTTAFTEDANTLLLIHSDTTNGSTTFTDDSGVVGGLGNDASSNTNNWTLNNLAATDQMLDTPTNNFCTLNSVSKGSSIVLKEGNLDVSRSVPGHRYSVGTLGVSSGKWYWEIYLANSTGPLLGIATPEQLVDANDHDTTSTAWNWDTSGPNSYGDGNGHGIYGSTTTLGDIVGVELDMDAGTIDFYKNNVSEGEMFNTLSGNTILPCAYIHGTAANVIFNFGQDSSFAGNKTAQGNQDSNSIGDFYYTPPTDFLALCTSNLPDPAVIPSEHFNTVLYTGNLSSGHAITGVGFAPDFVWAKGRSFLDYHSLFDSVRGANKHLSTNTTSAEADDFVVWETLDSDGFTVGSNSMLNKSGATFVAWNWKAGGTGVSNTNGSITSTVSANADAGFSIVSYTGTGSNATIGHGLSKAPEMLIIKNRDQTDDWIVYHEGIGNTSMLRLNTSGAKNTYVTWWNNTSPTSTVFTVSTEHRNNASSEDYIAYCFHSVDGYSKVGSYTSNGSTDGTFVYTGFRPAYVMIKSTNGYGWFLMDSKRSPFNLTNDFLRPNASDAEYEALNSVWDGVSNGFKIRGTGADVGASGGTYIYLAFAEHPFKHTNAR